MVRKCCDKKRGAGEKSREKLWTHSFSPTPRPQLPRRASGTRAPAGARGRGGRGEERRGSPGTCRSSCPARPGPSQHAERAKYAKMEAEREVMRQGIRDKYGIKKKEEKEAEAQAAMEANAEGSLTRPKKAIPPGCGDEEEEEEESILDTVIKYLPGPLQDMFKK
uniref:Complexin-1 n=1 Tax=Taeniopygia guttata TaxID=59729 RepID=A0A674GUS1_TAEGU